MLASRHVVHSFPSPSFVRSCLHFNLFSAPDSLIRSSQLLRLILCSLCPLFHINMTGRSELVVSCVASNETRSSDHLNKSVIITTTGQRPLQIQIVGNHTLASTKGSSAEKKKVITQKTRKIETRVQRQVVLKDGEVVADTGPQIITRTSDDSHCEDVESDASNLRLPDDEEPSSGPYDDPIVRCSSRTRTTRRSAGKEVNHFHDEVRREITDALELEKGLANPQDLLEEIENELHDTEKGGLTFYLNKSKEHVTKEKIKEISKLDSNGNIRTETTHTCMEEETTGEELPEHDVSIQMPRLLPPNSSSLQKYTSEGTHIIPVTREPFKHKNTTTSDISQSVATTDGQPKPTGNNERQASWKVERREGDDGKTELWVKRKNRGNGSTSSTSLIQALKETSHNNLMQKRFLQKSEIQSVSYQFWGTRNDLIGGEGQATSNWRSAAERRQRGVLLDGHESCPSPPDTQNSGQRDGETHYELLWNAHTGERRSPSPSKSETFTKSRGRRIAKLLSSRRTTRPVQ